MTEHSEQFLRAMQKSLNLRLLNDACMKAADAFVTVLEQEGQPQYLPHDKARWRKEMVFACGMTMTEWLQSKTGQGT